MTSIKYRIAIKKALFRLVQHLITLQIQYLLKFNTAIIA